MGEGRHNNIYYQLYFSRYHYNYRYEIIEQSEIVER